jgi:DNA (cytosine-5)-methyltransferase 1
MKYLSLFSGIEAATVAWKSLDFECVGVSEIDPFCSALLEQRLPNIKNFGNIQQITMEKLYENEITTNKKPNIIIGGSPCQSFSVAGARKGTDDPRGQLMYEFVRVISIVKPQYIVWENVRGALSTSGGKDFGSLLGSLVECGYDLEWRVLDTQEFGLPQSRSRVYLVGCLGGFRGGSVLFNQGSNGRNTEPSNKKGSKNATSLDRDVKVTQTKTITNGRNIVGCLCARDYKGVGSDCVQAGKVVIEMGSKEVRLRRLTPKEYERLQGFPDDWTQIPWNGKSASECPLTHRYRSLGNTMSVPVVRWVGHNILKHYTAYMGG